MRVLMEEIDEFVFAKGLLDANVVKVLLRNQ